MEAEPSSTTSALRKQARSTNASRKARVHTRNAGRANTTHSDSEPREDGGARRRGPNLQNGRSAGGAREEAVRVVWRQLVTAST